LKERNRHKRRRGPTLSDVAKLAKVSTSAVSRTFTIGSSVSEGTRSRILKAAAKLGYRPNLLASSLMTGRSSLIALASNAFNDPQVMTIIDTFTIELQRRQLRPLIFNLTRMNDWVEAVALMSQYQIDGIIIASSTLNQNFVRHVQKSGIPTVLAFGRDIHEVGISASFVDNVEGGRTAATAFLRRDYRELGFIGAHSEVSTTKDRLAGYYEVLNRNEVEPIVVHSGEYSHDAGRRAVNRLLVSHPKIDAIFCADDLLAMGAMDGIRYDLRRSIPEIGVIGFSDMQMSRWPSYDLSTFATNVGRVVENAIEIMQSQIENGAQIVEKRIVGCELVARKSIRELP